MKSCTKCHRELEYTAFNRNRNTKDGHNSWCKECSSAYTTSEQGRAKRRIAHERYKQSEAGKAAIARAAELRKQRMQAAKGRVTSKQWNELVRRCARRCARCGASGKLLRDHIAPVSKGGDNTLANLQPLCPECNNSKGNRYVRDFRTADVIAWAKEQTVLSEKQYQSTTPPDQIGS